mmetsp:Transcript_31032/g.74991  ORF Transcript_31032/g.74991 Transcript_31032/m.74991 type:complete len:292 (-) Transcript_31032:844-1719(-)
MIETTLDCILGSIAAGCFSTVLGHSLDTIKVNQQTNPKFSSLTSFQVAQSLLAKDGGTASRLFFQGIGPPMVNQIVMNSVMFLVFNKVKQVSNESTVMDENSAALFAGLFAGFATACLSTPTDWLKIQAQTGGKEVSTTATILRRQLKLDGNNIPTFLRTLYSGHVANLGREGVFTLVYLGFYDRIAATVKASHGNENLDMMSVVMISSFTGACAWICNYPFDTAKSVIQAKTSTEKKTTTLSAISTIYESGGIKGFFRGLGPSTLRAMLVTSSRMLAYEKTLQFLSNFKL